MRGNLVTFHEYKFDMMMMMLCCDTPSKKMPVEAQAHNDLSLACTQVAQRPELETETERSKQTGKNSNKPNALL